jgi:hypothetical protein
MNGRRGKMTLQRLFIFITFCASAAFSYEPSLINCVVPSSLEAPSLELTLQHRFGRIIGKPQTNTFFGGATVRMGLRGQVWKGLEASLDYGVTGTELDAGAGYSYSFINRWLSGGAWAHFFTYEVPGGRATNVFVLAAAQSELLKDRLFLTVDASYDNYYIYFGIAAGVLVRIVPAVDLVAEYAPLHDDLAPNEKKTGSFSVGVKINTVTHQFKFLVSNSTDIGPREMMRGAQSNDLRFGFSLQKYFSW